MTNDAPPDPRQSLLDRFLNLFSEVRAGEGLTVVIMTLNLFGILVSYYIIKTVREPLILTGGGAEVKSYAAAIQAVLLMGAVPFYAVIASKVDRDRLSAIVTLFFFGCVQLFFVGAIYEIPYLGVLFFVWVGIFSLAIIAQFWGYANDIYDKDTGDRVFPIIGIGMTGGSFAGSALAAYLFDLGLSPPVLMQVAAALLLVSLVLYRVTAHRPEAAHSVGAKKTLSGVDGFRLILKSPYLRLIALLMVFLNLVNTTGEYILGKSVIAEAEMALRVAGDSVSDPKAFENAFIGAFYGKFYFGVNLVAVLLQAFVVSRLVKYVGMIGVLFALPIVSLGSYSLVALGVGFVVLRWAKTAENATDYSVMNTARQMLWLPTTRDEKYNAKQAIDTFFVRLGDVLSAALVFFGTEILGLDVQGFAGVNVLIVGVWLTIGWLLYREYRELARLRKVEAEPVEV